MPIILQNILILTLVGACAAFMLRGAYRALQGRKSRLSGCGSCSGCSTTTAPKPKTSPERLVMVPMDALLRTGARRSGGK